jgi:hypothetical protein
MRRESGKDISEIRQGGNAAAARQGGGAIQASGAGRAPANDEATQDLN